MIITVPDFMGGLRRCADWGRQLDILKLLKIHTCQKCGAMIYEANITLHNKFHSDLEETNSLAGLNRTY